jgi:hypothetical protein
MLKYVSKFAMDILPSVAATIIGAYIVNHYIVAKPAADAPAAAISAATKKTGSPKAADVKAADVKAADVKAADTKPADVKTDVTPAETSADVAKLPDAGVKADTGVKAKGISEKALLEKTAAEKPATAEKSVEKVADKPAETASIPVETRRHQPVAREKAIAKAVPPAAAPVATAPPVEAAVAPEEHRDANELARAAIERLRGSGEGSPRPPEAARIPDAARVAVTPSPPAPPASPLAVRPLPPPVVVSIPGTGAYDATTGSAPNGSAYPEASDPRRPTPPAEIPLAPLSRPLDLRAEVTVPAAKEHTSVADDVLSAAKSVFHAVLPKISER